MVSSFKHQVSMCIRRRRHAILPRWSSTCSSSKGCFIPILWISPENCNHMCQLKGSTFCARQTNGIDCNEHRFIPISQRPHSLIGQTVSRLKVSFDESWKWNEHERNSRLGSIGRFLQIDSMRFSQDNVPQVSTAWWGCGRQAVIKLRCSTDVGLISESTIL